MNHQSSPSDGLPTPILPSTARAMLAALPGVKLLDLRLAETGAPIVLCMVRCRMWEVRLDGDAASAVFYASGSEELPLAEGVGLPAALCAVADLVSRIGHLPAAPWSAEREAAERSAAAEVRQAHRPVPAEAAQLPLPVAMATH